MSQGSTPLPPGKENSTSEKGATRPVNGSALSATPSIVVTQATHTDIPDICNLYKRVWDEFRGKFPEDLLKAWQPTPLEFTSWMEGVTYFSARRDRRLVGVLGGSLQDGSVRLVNLGVDPEARRSGIATLLVGASLEWARRANASSVWVEVLLPFEGAIHLFQKLGFTQSGVLHKHFWKEDVQLLEQVL